MNPVRGRAKLGLRVRLAGLVALGVLLVVDVYANVIGDQSYVAGGDCGGKSCRNPGTDQGVAIAVAIVMLLVVVASWPGLRRRLRDSEPTL